MAFDLPYKELIRLMRNLSREAALRIILLLSEEEFIDKDTVINSIVVQTLLPREKVKDTLKNLYYQNLVEFSGEGVSYPNERPKFSHKAPIYIKLANRGKNLALHLNQLINLLEE